MVLLSPVSLLVFEHKRGKEGDSNSFSGRLYTLLAIYNVVCHWATSVRGAKDGNLFFQLGFLFGKAIRLQDNYLASPAAYW
jgi:hypothetical protein